MSPRIPFLKFLKKAPKAKRREKAAPAVAKVPGVSRVGIFGHASSGKTVFLTVLYDTAGEDPMLRLTTLNDETAAELHKNIRTLKGVERVLEEGRWKEVSQDRRFPEPTSEETELSFEANFEGGASIRFSCLDYPGSAVSTGESSKESISQYLSESDCLFLFLEPDLLDSEVLREERLATFVNLIQRLGGRRGRITVPVGVVVNKADLLEGLDSEDQCLLIGSGSDYLKASSFEGFLHGVLRQRKMVKQPKWAARVRDLLRKLRSLLEPLMSRTLDFQIFLCSATGPLLEGGNAPPSELRPIGIRAPLYWAASRLITKRRIRGLRRFTKWLFFLVLLWLFVFSIPYFVHFRVVLPRPGAIEEQVLGRHGLSPSTFYQAGFSQELAEDVETVAEAYGNYSQSRTVRAFFKGFRAPATAFERFYSSWSSKGQRERKIEEMLFYFKARSDTLHTRADSLESDDPEYASKADEIKARAGAVRDSLLRFRDSDPAISATYGSAIAKLEQRLSDLVALLKSEIGGVQAKPIEDKFQTYVEMYRDGVSTKDYNLLLAELPARLKELREELRAELAAGGSGSRTGAIEGILGKIDKYLRKAEKWETRLMRFEVKGVPPDGDYSLTVSTISGAVYDGTRYQIRLPVDGEAELSLVKVGVDKPVDTYRPGPGYAILSLDGKQIELKGGRKIQINFLGSYKRDIPKLR